MELFPSRPSSSLSTASDRSGGLLRMRFSDLQRQLKRLIEITHRQPPSSYRVYSFANASCVCERGFQKRKFPEPPSDKPLSWHPALLRNRVTDDKSRPLSLLVRQLPGAIPKLCGHQQCCFSKTISVLPSRNTRTPRPWRLFPLGSDHQAIGSAYRTRIGSTSVRREEKGFRA